MFSKQPRHPSQTMTEWRIQGKGNASTVDPVVRIPSLVPWSADIPSAEIAPINAWSEHYQRELVEMYLQCCPPALQLSFTEFVELAFVCTNGDPDIARRPDRCHRPLI